MIRQNVYEKTIIDITVVRVWCDADVGWDEDE